MRFFDERKVVIEIDKNKIYVNNDIYQYVMRVCEKKKLDHEIVFALLFNIKTSKFKKLQDEEKRKYINTVDKIKQRIAERYYDVNYGAVYLRLKRKLVKIQGNLYKIIDEKCKELQLDTRDAFELIYNVKKKTDIDKETLDKYKALLEYLHEMFYSTEPLAFGVAGRVIHADFRKRIIKAIRTLEELAKKATIIINITVHPLIFLVKHKQIVCLFDVYRTYTYYTVKNMRINKKTLSRLLRRLFGELIDFVVMRDYIYLRDALIVERASPPISIIDCWLRRNLSESFDRKLESDSCWIMYYVSKINIIVRKNEIPSNVVSKTYECDPTTYEFLCSQAGTCDEEDIEQLRKETYEKLVKDKIVIEQQKPRLRDRIKNFFKKLLKKDNLSAKSMH